MTRYVDVHPVVAYPTAGARRMCESGRGLEYAGYIEATGFTPDQVSLAIHAKLTEAELASVPEPSYPYFEIHMTSRSARDLAEALRKEADLADAPDTWIWSKDASISI
jgi:hypothetical protein